LGPGQRAARHRQLVSSVTASGVCILATVLLCFFRRVTASQAAASCLCAQKLGDLIALCDFAEQRAGPLTDNSLVAERTNDFAEDCLSNSGCAALRRSLSPPPPATERSVQSVRVPPRDKPACTKGVLHPSSARTRDGDTSHRLAPLAVRTLDRRSTPSV
jgi:hypothetical protein